MDKQVPEAVLDFVYDLEQYDKTFSLTSHVQHTLPSKVRKTSPEREPLPKKILCFNSNLIFCVEIRGMGSIF